MHSNLDMVKFKNKFLKLLTSILFIILATNNCTADEVKSYNKLVEDWPKIFPDGNRNAASPRFF